MGSPHRDSGEILDALEKAVRAQSWQTVEILAGRLCAMPPPTGAEDALVYLGRVRKSLIAARAGRAHLLTLRARVRAAVGFNSGIAS